jgi:hypothetical protein
MNMGSTQAASMHCGRFEIKPETDTDYQEFMQRFTKCPLSSPYTNPPLGFDSTPPNLIGLRPNGGEGGIGSALPNRCATASGAPSPVAFAPYVEQVLIPCSGCAG